ncbi:MAG: UDP-N-acetylmuramoyl-L-alanine--D-glutamate ligase [Thermodesulfovibrionales bacterium]|nr:UDP-N-acetylmuramoyl-L-alanine--D-glutamate ligase [Thermodesulfovibrionales bacterium]
MEIKDKNILVFGLAESGVGASNLLARFGARVTVTDSKPKEALMKYCERLLPSIKLSLGGHPDGILQGVDMIVLSPGVPPDIAPLKKAKELGIRIIGELEFAYQVISGQRSEVRGQKTKFLAVTGTNGKSTTTTLLNEMLNKGGFRTIIGGNIGNALTEEILKAISNQPSAVSPPTHPSPSGGEGKGEGERYALNADYIVAEVSSFQLESVDKFRPKGATILNITPDHLDRYHSMKKYKDAKARIFANQGKGDYLVLNADDPETMKLRNEKLDVSSEKPKIFFFSRFREVSGLYFKNGIVYSNISESSLPTSHFPLINVGDIRIKGVHNLENAMAASAMALLAGCPAEAVVTVLKKFEGLEHRLELVRKFEDVDYINDSKGTNVDAVVKSLESFSMPVILIVGGRDKDGDFSLLSSLIKRRVKKLILIGEAREKIKEFLGGLTETVFADNLKEAVMISRKSASKGDVVLLSPACASFDMFRDYKDRGEQFKKIVRDLS